MKRLALFALATLAGGAHAQVVTNLWNGPQSLAQRALDLVILGDGYTAAQQTTFNADAAQLTARLTAPAGSSGQLFPFSSYRFELRVWSVFAASAQSGVDLPIPINGVPAQTRDTRYNCAYNVAGTARCVLPVNGVAGSNGPVHSASGLTQAIADANLIAPLVPPQPVNLQTRVFIVLVNQPNVYGGCAQFSSSGTSYCAAFNGNFLAANPTVGVQTQLHELGHAIGLLGDEYSDENPATNLVFTGPLPFPFANLTTTPSSPPWAVWVPLIGPPVAGGLNFDTGIFHPSPNCLMNRLFLNGNNGPFPPATVLGAAQGFDAVSGEQLIRQISGLCNPYVGYVPATTAPVTVVQGANQVFGITTLATTPQTYQWRVNGAVVQTTNAPAFTLNTSTYPLGALTVDCIATDINPAIRNPAGGLVAAPSTPWTVNVIAPTPDLTFAAGSIGTASSANAGGGLLTVGTVRNAGTAATLGGVLVEYFLMQAPTTINPATDILFGREVAPALAVNATYTSNFTPTLPFYVAPGTYYLGAWVDRSGVSGDSNPANNTQVSAVPITIASPLGCPTMLEIAGPLALGTTTARISATAGATLPLALTAPCQVGATYIVAASVTGTSPGIPVGGFTLPLVFDFVTQLALDNINLPPFLLFQATVGANGRATATFAPPPGYLSPGNFQVWFAATLLTGGTVTGVTNPVAIRIGT